MANVKDSLTNKFNSITELTFGEFILSIIKTLLVVLFFTSAFISGVVMCNLDGRTIFCGLTLQDYFLMFSQSIVGILAVILLPYIIKKMHIKIPTFFWTCFYIIIFGAIYLGEINNYYNYYEHWDDILHFLSGAIIAMFFYCLLNSSKRIKNNVHPFILLLISFSATMSICGLWEIYEYTFDSLFDTNMQKYILANHVVLTGHEALADTMQDIIVGTLGALFTCVVNLCALLGHYHIKQSMLFRRIRVHADSNN